MMTYQVARRIFYPRARGGLEDREPLEEPINLSASISRANDFHPNGELRLTQRGGETSSGEKEPRILLNTKHPQARSNAVARNTPWDR